MEFRKFFATIAGAASFCILPTAPAFGQVSGDVVRIGFITDMSGLYTDIDGPGGVEAIRIAIAEMGGGDTVFVGDSEIDADTATAAGVPFYLFTEGYRKSPVARMAHHAAFADFAALPGLIAAHQPG